MIPRRFLALVLATPRLVTAQGDAGTALWRVAGQTLAVPPALAQGTAAVFWNPAQPAPARLAVALDGVQGATAIGATGVVAAARARLGPIGAVGVLYGQMQISDLVRTSTSPIPDPGVIAYHTRVVGVTWARAVGRATLGATAARHGTALDEDDQGRWTLDLGAAVPIGSRVRVAGATHFFSRLDAADPAQDVYLGVEVLAWRGVPWDGAPEASVQARYGTAVAHGFTADQHVGVGFALGHVVTVDLLASYEGGYAAGGWQPVAAIGFQVSDYRLAVAANPGAAGLGPAFRVGLDVSFP
ncbi:MAG TPA: hypothetical protein VD707_07875 [Gemmatimonadales bacterium]|nr:hypothetical protein [Gemmatimonadales bacterium]